MQKVLAITEKGNLDYCSVDLYQRGRGGCTHIVHKENSESDEDFLNKVEKIALEKVKENGLNLKFISTQTPELCLAAVRQNGLAIKYVKDQTPELCLEAVRYESNALNFVNLKFYEECKGVLC